MTAKFYRTTVTVDILTREEPLHWNNLVDIHNAESDCDASIHYGTGDTVEITEDQLRSLCVKHGTDVSFFGLEEREEAAAELYRVTGTLCETRTFDVDNVVLVPLADKDPEQLAAELAMSTVMPEGSSTKAANFEWLDGPSVEKISAAP